MSQEKITINFEPKGHPQLIKALNNLALAQEKVKGGTSGSTQAAKKFNSTAAALTAKLKVQNIAWKELGISSGVLKKAYQGNRIALEKLKIAMGSATKAGMLQTRNTRLLSNAFATLRSKLLLASFAATMVATTIGRLTKLFGEQEKAEKKLEIQLGGVSKELLKFASAQQQVTRFGDEVTISAMATAAAYTKNQDQIKKLMESAMDLSVFLDQDLNATVTLLSKSIFSSTNQLSRYGVSFEGAVGTSARFENALKAVQERAGGLATGEAATLNFALDQMGNAVGDLGENLGTVFVPLIMASAKGVKAFAEFMDENRVKSYTSALIAGASAYGIYAVATGKASTAMVAFNKISKKNLIVFAGMLVVGELIEKFNLFSDGSDDLEDSLSKVNNTASITLAKQQALAIASEEYHNAQLGVSEIESKRLLNQLKLVHLGDQIKAGTIEAIDADIKRKQLLTEQIGLEKALIAIKLQSASKGLAGLASLNEATKGSIKVTARLRQVQAVIDAWAAYNVALTSAPPPFNFIQAAGALAAGFASVRNIEAEIPKLAQGGLIGGRRHSQGGTMIEAEQGEFVMSRNAVESIGIENLNRMNQAGRGGAVTVNVSGNVMTQDFVENDLAEAIKEATRRGTDFGVG